jgi:hypothetical protein
MKVQINTFLQSPLQLIKLVADAKLPGVIQKPKFKIVGSQGIAEVNTTFLRGYMHKTQNTLKTTIKKGVSTNQDLKKYVAPGKLEIWTTECESHYIFNCSRDFANS